MGTYSVYGQKQNMILRVDDRIDSECGHTVFGELFQFSQFSPRRTQMRALYLVDYKYERTARAFYDSATL